MAWGRDWTWRPEPCHDLSGNLMWRHNLHASGLVLKEGRGTEEVLCGAYKHPGAQSLCLLRADTHQLPPTANQAQCPHSKGWQNLNHLATKTLLLLKDPCSVGALFGQYNQTDDKKKDLCTIASFQNKKRQLFNYQVLARMSLVLAVLLRSHHDDFFFKENKICTILKLLQFKNTLVFPTRKKEHVENCQVFSYLGSWKFVTQFQQNESQYLFLSHIHLPYNPCEELLLT